MSLPNPGMDAVPFTPLTAEFLDNMIENIEALADGSGLDAGSISNANLNTTAGELGGTWQSWTPTLGNFVVGSGTLIAKYTMVGKTVHFRFTFIYGSGSSVSGTMRATLPVPPAADYEYAAINGDYIGKVTVTDNVTAVYEGNARLIDSSSTINFVLQGATSTYVNQPSSVTGGAPMTWATGDRLYWSGTYEAL